MGNWISFNDGDDELEFLKTQLPSEDDLLDGLGGRGLHSFTSQLNLSRDRHKKTPYTPWTPPSTPLSRATQPLRAPPIPSKALRLS
jgi:hypothetical protein